LARGGQCTVDGRSADLQDLGTDDRIQVKVAMPLHCIDQDRDQGLQALTADTIGGLPPHRERLPYGFVVKTIAHGGNLSASGFLAQHTNGMLAVISRQSYEFVKNLDPVAESRIVELTPFHGHLMVQTEGVRDEQIPNGVRAGVPPATY